MRKLKKIKRPPEFVLVTISTVACAIINFIYAVYARKYVAPLDYGLFSSCTIFQTYMAYLQLGTLNAYNRDYPQLLGAGKDDDARRLKSLVFSFIFTIYMFVVFVAEIAFGVYGAVSQNIPTAIGLMCAAGLALLVEVENFMMYSCRMKGGFDYSALVGICRALISFAAGLFFVKTIGYYGLYAKVALMSVIGILMYIRCMRDVKLNFRIFKQIKDTWKVIKSGIPLLINGLIWTVVSSIDKFVILGCWNSPTNLVMQGNYSIATLGFSTLVIIPQTISHVFYVNMCRVYGRDNSSQSLINAASQYTFINGLISAIFSVGAFYILPMFVSLAMPKYTDGVAAAQIIILGVAIYASTMLLGNVFTILKKNLQLLTNSIALCVFNAVFSLCLVLFVNKDITSVALGTALSYAAYSVLLIFRLRKIEGVRIGNIIRTTWGPILCAILPCIAISYIMPLFSDVPIIGKICGMSIYAQFAIAAITAVVLIAVFFLKDIKELFIGRKKL